MRRLPVVESRLALREPSSAPPPGFGVGGLPRLEDPRGRVYSYLRLSITDRCDLACVYCMPPGGELEHGLRDELLSFEETERLVRVAASMGVVRVRLTGGEPLVRRGVVELVERVASVPGITDVVMTTNGTRLATLAGPLRRAGLRGVNVSIDSLDADRFARLTRGGELAAVLAGIEAARAEGLRVKLNTVVIRGENDADAESLVDFAWARGLVPRFIELMPIGEAAALGAERVVPWRELEARLAHLLDDAREAHAAGAHHGPARYRRSRDGAHEVGFITAVSDEFCGACNRIRITAQGDVRACLASRRALSLRDVLRSGGDDRALAYALHAALGTKAAGHAFLDAAHDEHTHVGMSLIGG